MKLWFILTVIAIAILLIAGICKLCKQNTAAEVLYTVGMAMLTIYGMIFLLCIFD